MGRMMRMGRLCPLPSLHLRPSCMEKLPNQGNSQYKADEDTNTKSEGGY